MSRADFRVTGYNLEMLDWMKYEFNLDSREHAMIWCMKLANMCIEGRNVGSNSVRIGNKEVNFK